MTESERLLRDGILALKAGQRAEARHLLAEAVKADPKNEWGWIYLAALLPPEQALTALERAVKLNPQNAQAQRGLVVLREQVNTAPLATSQFAGRVRNGLAHRTGNPPEEALAPVTTPDNLRDLLAKPADEIEKKKFPLWPVFLSLGLVAVALVAMVIVYLNVIKPASSNSAPVGVVSPEATDPTLNSLTVATGVPTADAAPVPIGLPDTTVPTTSELKSATPLPAPTAILPVNLRVLQSQRAELRSYIFTFSSYDNKSANFAQNGAGAPRAGRHFEGIVVQVENKSNKVLPLQTDAFQALDGRNNYLQPVNGGRLPSLDLPRLQPGEIRVAWLTFEVEDGTTLRRVVFNGPPGLDAGSTIEVNLTLPPATPGPSATPSKAPTAVPTSTPSPKPTVTATSVPTTAPTATATAIPGNNVTQVATVGLTAPALVATPEPTATAIPNPTATATPAPTATPEPTATAIPTATPDRPPTATPAPKAEMKQRYALSNAAVTVTQYVKEPTVKAQLLPAGYHYEAVKVTLENLSGKEQEFADFINSYPFYLRDGEGRVYTTGPLSLDGPEHLDPKVFATPAAKTTTPKAAAKQASGMLYFLVRDGAKTPRIFVFYSSNEVDSDRVEISLK
jgi:tetratricopeptide (TPR) repeat protein